MKIYKLQLHKNHFLLLKLIQQQVYYKNIQLLI